MTSCAGKSSYLAGDDLQGLANVLPDAELPESEVFYYYGVVELFKHAGETRWAVHFAELILAEADDELDVGTMWTEVFRGYLDLALYDDAYSTLVNIPGDEDQLRAPRLPCGGDADARATGRASTSAPSCTACARTTPRRN
jgi:hypothetical protein